MSLPCMSSDQVKFTARPLMASWAVTWYQRGKNSRATALPLWLSSRRHPSHSGRQARIRLGQHRRKRGKQICEEKETHEIRNLWSKARLMWRNRKSVNLGMQSQGSGSWVCVDRSHEIFTAHRTQRETDAYLLMLLCGIKSWRTGLPFENTVLIKIS